MHLKQPFLPCRDFGTIIIIITIVIINTIITIRITTTIITVIVEIIITGVPANYLAR